MSIDALLDRDGELAALDDLLARLTAGRGATVFISGVPGIGKTALLRYGRERAAAADMRVLAASGSEMDRHLPFSGLRQLFFDIQRSGAELRGPAAGAAPALGIREVDEPPDAAAVAHSLRWILSGFATTQPVLLVVDDLQWIDPASRQVLAHLWPRTQDSAVGFLLAARPGDDDAVDFDQALRDADCVELLPAPLSVGAVGRLIDEAADDPVDPSFVESCVEVTGGVPFLVAELLRDVHARGISHDATGAASVRRLAPRSVQRHVLARLERLPVEARRFANAAAILPPGADPALAAEVAGVADQQLTNAVGLLIAAYVLRDRPLDFLHPVMRSAVVEALSSLEVSDTHRRAATALRRRSADAAEIALHLLHTSPSGSEQDADVLAEVGAAAAAAGAPDTAAEYLRRALAEPPAPAARHAVLAALGRALAATGDRGAVSTLQAAFDSAPDAAQRTQTALLLAEVLGGDEDRPDDAVRLLQCAAENLAADDDLRLALLARLTVFANRSGLPDVQSWCLSQIPAGLTGDTPAQRACMVIRAYGDTPEQPRKLLMTAARHPEFVSGELPGSVTVGWAIMGLRAIGEVEFALDLAQRAAAYAEGVGRPGAVARRLGQSALMHWRRGRLAEARRTLEQARKFLAGTTSESDRTWIQTAELRIAVASGRLDEAAQIARLLPASAGLTTSQVWLARAELAAALGDLAAAAELFPRPKPQQLELDPAQVDPAPRGAIWLAAAGRTQEAHEVLKLVERHVEHFRSAATRGLLLSARGVVERDVDLVRCGVDTLADTEFRFAHAEAVVDLGMLLRRSGALRQAREALRNGLEEAREMGAVLLAQTAAAELTVAGGRKIARTARGAAALTGAEQRVARRAAGGATNAQIADALFVNVKTVEMHLANSYRKLGITSRTDLAKALQDSDSGGSEGETMKKASQAGPVS